MVLEYFVILWYFFAFFVVFYYQTIINPYFISFIEKISWSHIKEVNALICQTKLQIVDINHTNLGFGMLLIDGCVISW